MTTRIGADGPARGAGPRRELAVVTLLGAAGAGLVLLATRQDLARVMVRAPRPLPATTQVLTGQDLRPAVAALAVAALASLAAVLATRGLLRRFTGLITAVLGAGIAALAVSPVTVSEVLAAAGRAGAAQAAGAGAGLAAGSATAGSATGLAGGSIAGFPAQVVLTGAGWRGPMAGGALVLVVVGFAVMVRAGRLPAMSARYSQPDGASGAVSEPAPARSRPGSPGVAARPASVQAGMWESLSAGVDPTASPERGEDG